MPAPKHLTLFNFWKTDLNRSKLPFYLGRLSGYWLQSACGKLATWTYGIVEYQPVSDAYEVRQDYPKGGRIVDIGPGREHERFLSICTEWMRISVLTKDT